MAVTLAALKSSSFSESHAMTGAAGFVRAAEYLASQAGTSVCLVDAKFQVTAIAQPLRHWQPHRVGGCADHGRPNQDLRNRTPHQESLAAAFRLGKAGTRRQRGPLSCSSRRTARRARSRPRERTRCKRGDPDGTISRRSRPCSRSESEQARHHAPSKRTPGNGPGANTRRGVGSTQVPHSGVSVPQTLINPVARPTQPKRTSASGASQSSSSGRQSRSHWAKNKPMNWLLVKR